MTDKARRGILGTFIGSALLLTAGSGAAAELKLMCVTGMKEIIPALVPQLEAAVGRKVTVAIGQAGELKTRLEGGEIAGVVVMARVVLDQTLAEGLIVAGTAVDLSQSSMGAGVRRGQPKPDFGSIDGFRQALLAAKAIVITDPGSGGVAGVHMADVFRRLGIAEQIQPRLTLNRRGANAEFVANGEADNEVLRKFRE